MSKRLGVGIIGGGFNGCFHIKGFVGVRHADVLGVCSRTKESAEKAAKLSRDLETGDAKAFNSITEMVKSPEIDAVWVCSPNYNRVEVIEEIVKAGKGKLKGIACEKPLARNVEEAQKVVGLAKDFNTGYLENQVYCPMVVRGKGILWARGASRVYSGYRGPTYRTRLSHGTAGPMHIGPKRPQRVANSAPPKT